MPAMVEQVEQGEREVSWVDGEVALSVPRLTLVGSGDDCYFCGGHICFNVMLVMVGYNWCE